MSDDVLQWDDLRLFLAVAQEGGLSPAARITKSSPATLARRMRALEISLGQDLFIRHDRGYTLTAYGQDLRGNMRDVEVRIDHLTVPHGQPDCPLVKVSAGTWTALKLLSHLDRLSGTPVDLRLRFMSSEIVLDMPHRVVDIGFRNQRPTELNLAGRKLSRIEFAPYACHDAPRRWIKVLADTPSARWLDKAVGNDAVCEVNAPRNSLDLALAGQGIALLPTFIGGAHAVLEQTGPNIAVLSHDQWIVSHQDDRHLPHVRRAIDRMSDIMTT